MAEAVIIPIEFDTSSADATLRNVDAPVQKMTSNIFKLKQSTTDFISTIKRDLEPSVVHAFKSGTVSITQMQSVLETLRENMRNTTNPIQLQRYNLAIKDVEGSIKKAAAAGAQMGSEVAKGAGKAFTTLRQLANVLPGIGLAGLIGVAVTGFEALARAIFNTKTRVDQYGEAVKSATESTGAEIFKINALVAVAKDENNTRQQRNNAVAQLQKQYPDYLRNLSLETIGSDAAKKSIDALTKSIFQKAVATELASRFAKKQVEILDKEKEITKQVATVEANRRKFQTQPQGREGLSQPIEKIFDENKLARLRSQLDDLRSESTEILQLGQKALAESLDFTNLTTLAKDEKALDDIKDKIIQRAKAIANELKNAFVVPEFSATFSKDKLFKIATDFLDAFKRGALQEIKVPLDKFTVPVDELILKPEKIKVDEGNFLVGKRQVAFHADVDIDTPVNQGLLDKQFERLSKLKPSPGITGGGIDFKKMAEDAAKTADTISAKLTPAFDGLVDAIFTSTDPIQAFWKGVQQSIQDTIKQLIQATIRSLLFKAIFGAATGGIGSGLSLAAAGFTGDINRQAGGAMTLGGNVNLRLSGLDLVAAINANNTSVSRNFGS
jgi:hypothetical protein